MQYEEVVVLVGYARERHLIYLSVCVSGVRLFHMFLNNKPQAAQLNNIIWDMHCEVVGGAEVRSFTMQRRADNNVLRFISARLKYRVKFKLTHTWYTYKWEPHYRVESSQQIISDTDMFALFAHLNQFGLGQCVHIDRVRSLCLANMTRVECVSVGSV